MHHSPVADGATVSAAPDVLDAVDKALLELIQTAFPLSPRPYAIIGEHIGTGEEEAFERVRSLRARGLIRRIGGNFQSGKLGFHSTLCAAKVPEDVLDSFIAAVNAEPGVTHNYLRDHAYNIWFTCIGPSRDAVAATLAGITERTGVAILNLPAKKLYKIRVDFKLTDEPDGQN